MVVVFLQFYGTTTTEEAPSGERFLDNRKFESTVKEIIDNATDYVMASMRKGSLIRGVTRQDIPEYPEVALREAIVNAVAHRTTAISYAAATFRCGCLPTAWRSRIQEGFMVVSPLTN
jgi:predicted HTH transcriptional regulator